MADDRTLEEIVDDFTSKIAAHLDPKELDGPLRLDPTRTVVIIALKDRDPIHVHVNHQINDEGVESVLRQIGLVPSLQKLLKT